ncbi:LysR substrate-binding domain-containing protein [Pseudolabrys sp. FHR47]|uniref:LysR substrate-binding domain-containing protein n=1 Tax=Pseudolabrys sp. FHR47 TaxID=2562284 RepID=UPI0010BEF64D|nr:LysR substrate-binding domain-containing protein [Pseudolabrys sp. FHR47]
MLDIELLRSFVSVVDSGGFTRAGERVHRTQSTVSQQIKRLEESVGRPLLVRNGKQATPTEEGERLLTYARRILALEQEARDVVSQPVVEGVVRLGIPEDFAAYRLVELLSDFARGRPTLRLDVRCGLSVVLRGLLDRGDLDVALIKRNLGESGGIASWPERLQWVTSKKHPVDLSRDPVPIAVAEQGCLYRNRLIHALESAGRTWHVAYTSPNLPGIQAAVAAGLGVAVLPDVAITDRHRIIDTHGLAPLTNTEIALIVSERASPAARRIADVLAEFCTELDPRRRAQGQPAKQRLAAKA